MLPNDPNAELAAATEYLHRVIGGVISEEARVEEAKKWRNCAREGRMENGVWRDRQLPPPGNWTHWLALCGRSFGKTRMAAEFHKEEVLAGRARRTAIIAPTAADLRDVIVEGDSGILNVWRNEPQKPEYKKTDRQVQFPNGSVAYLYSADEPERLRGPNISFYWFDELAACRYAQKAWDMLQMTLRIGSHPRGIVTTTPKPLALLKKIRDSAYTVLSTGTAYDNRANLAPSFFDVLKEQYEGTRLGRQELLGEYLEQEPDALWNRSTLEDCRVDEAPELVRIIVIIDPAVSDDADSNETGIIVEGLGANGRGYVLWDGSMRGRPDQWAAEAVRLYHWVKADGIVAEKNQGGDMVEAVLRSIDANIPYRSIHASRSKTVRAEPVAALYEKKRVHHVRRFKGEQTDFRTLEDQYCQLSVSTGFTGRGSPDHADAAVHGFHELILNANPASVAFLEVKAEKHVAAAKAIDYWLYRWVSVSLGSTSAAHWYVQDGDQVRVYRELVMDNASVQRFGEEVAKLSESDLKDVQILNVYLGERHFDTFLGHKSIAQQLSDGINHELGRGGSFLFNFNAEEKHTTDEQRRMFLLQQRKEAAADHRITLLAAAGEPEAAWEHLRTLLRWKPAVERPCLTWDRDFYLKLKGADPERAEQYVKAVKMEVPEERPKLVIDDTCPATMRALGALSRDDKNAAMPLLIGENGAIAQSVLAGMMAHRQTVVRQPLEEFVAARLSSVKKRNPDAGQDVFIRVRQKAEHDWKQMQPGPMELHWLPVRRRA